MLIMEKREVESERGREGEFVAEMIYRLYEPQNSKQTAVTLRMKERILRRAFIRVNICG